MRLNALIVSLILMLPHATATASLASKTWPASDEARQFVKDTIVIGMMASPGGF